MSIPGEDLSLIMFEATKAVVETTMFFMALHHGYLINKEFFDGIIKFFIKKINQNNKTPVYEDIDQSNEQIANQTKITSLNKDTDN